MDLVDSFVVLGGFGVCQIGEEIVVNLSCSLSLWIYSL